MTRQVYLDDLGIVCALGSGKQQIAERLFQGYGDSLSSTSDFTFGSEVTLGIVKEPLPSLQHFPASQQSRSNQLLLAALSQIQLSLDAALAGVPSAKIGVILGVSTSGIREGEEAWREYFANGQFPENYSYELQEMSAPAEFLAEQIGADGPAFNISTACSSSAKALASARRLIRHGICDVVVAGGVDVLCKLTVNGFSALDSVSASPCVPFSRNRSGINIGEGAALFVVTGERSASQSSVTIAGVGETSDAHHISAPAPDGRGAIAAMQQALDDAGCSAAELDYLNLHGTATPLNDSMEGLAVNQLFGSQLPCSSTKGYTGHTLGAAGAVEAGFGWLTLQQEALGISSPNKLQLPVHRWDGAMDESIPPIKLVSRENNRVASIERIMSNSFAFGGNNIAVLLERVQ
ncbi:beta-ketoacyl-ACP synthase [Aurantivibrio plasticivorans]